MRTIFLLGAIGFGLAAGSASGQAAQGNPEVLAYPLTLPRANHLITAMAAMTKYVVSLPDYQDRIRKSIKLSPAERLAQVENDPKAMAILKENSLTAKEYLVGVPALRMALMAAQGISAPNITVSPANLAFAKANLAELKPKMEAAEGLPASK